MQKNPSVSVFFGQRELRGWLLGGVFFVLLWMGFFVEAQAGLILEKKDAQMPVIRQVRFAVQVSQPVMPMWQKMQWSLVSPVFGAQKSKKSQKVAVAAVGKGTKAGKTSQDLRPKGKTDVDDNFVAHEKPRRVAAKMDAEELAEKRQAQLAQWHQIMGFTTLALLTATMVLGQINAVDFLNNRLSSQPMLWSHRIFSIATSATYLSTLIMALLFRKQPDVAGYESKGFDSSKWHKILAWIHGIGMALLVLGGVLNAHLIPSNTVGKLAFTVSHLAIGYTTWLSLGAATIIISFF